MSVRCKMKLSTILDYSNWSGKELTFTAEYDQTIPEDQRYARATPSGTIKITVDNPVALEKLELGRSYYVDFTPVPPPEPVAA